MRVEVKCDLQGKKLLTCVGGYIGDSNNFNYTAGGVIKVVDTDLYYEATVFLSVCRYDNDDGTTPSNINKSDVYVDSISPDIGNDNFEQNKFTILEECASILLAKINSFSGLEM